ncbi:MULTISPECIES: DUF2620 family protein [unclassified Streptomyces]|uniref:DUF2620 family protein n=1 Tax=unclassified Streptomyces TaxID=2593676 RepID=UPI001BEBCC00|nr:MULTISPECIES: DUF2620 family protein [unclassified Streptomyces]MBT2405777.1 DUF2620 family protein [Streptomyces sp. ISL-21]MBT2453522.1 DUF2620 family protein [Streptomyces sp. ISL-86]MBT2608233.1 DUF2620 family protein [Streptomyces sp. ISL-87]
MAKILTGGVGKAEVATTVTGLGLSGIEITVSNDMDAALELRTGQADYFLGTCHTGAGASLGVLVGLLGGPACHTFGRSVPTEADIMALLAQGKQVFGFAVDRIETVAPMMARAIAARVA